MGSNSNSNNQSATQEAVYAVRQSLSDAYAFVSGQQATKSFAALTFEELCQNQIDRIQGPDTDARPNALHRVQAVANNLTSAITQINALPADAFNVPTDDANTPDNQSGSGQ